MLLVPHRNSLKKRYSWMKVNGKKHYTSRKGAADISKARKN